MSTRSDKRLRRKPSQEPQDAYLEDYFTDMEPLQDLFQSLVVAPTLTRRILFIYGVGGIGKSTLLRMFRLYCKHRSIPVGLVGAENIKSAVDALTNLAKDLVQDGVRLPKFSFTLHRYQNIQVQVAQKGQKIEGITVKLGKVTAKTVVQAAASTIPVVGPLAATLGSMGVEAFVNWLRSFLSQPDINFYLNPVKPLTDDFLTDVAKAAARRRLVLILDTYEQMEALDMWLRDWVKALHCNTLVVIAGRTFPGEAWEQAWSGWMAQAHVEELKPMTNDALSTLVRRYHRVIQKEDPESAQVEAVVRFARGLPLAATTSARLWASYDVKEFQVVKAQVMTDLVDRLLTGVPEDLGRMVEAAATLRWFDRAVLRAVLGVEVSDIEYKELQRFPFVRPMIMGKLAVHDVMREIIDESLKIQDPERHRTWHERAAAYFEQLMGETGGEERELLFLERLYHLIQSGKESLAITESQTLIKTSLGYYRRPFVESVIVLLDQYLQQRRNRRWLVYLRYWVSLLNPSIKKQVTEATKLAAILDESNLDPHLRALIPMALGNVPTEANISPDKRIELLEEAMGSGLLSPQETTEGHLYLGNTLIEKGEWQRSIQSLRQALREYRTQGDPCGEIWTSHSLAYTFLLIGDWNNAIEWAQKAVALSRQLNGYRLMTSLEALGWTYTYCGQLSLALDAIEESLRLAKTRQDKAGVIIVSRRLAEIYDRQGRWSLSVPLYKSLLQEDEKFGRVVSKATFLALLGISYIKQGLGGQAERLLHDSLPHIHLHTKQIALIGLGELYLILRRLDESRQYFEQALSVSIGRPYYMVKSVLGLLQVDIASSKVNDMSDKIQKIQKLSLNLGYYDHLAHLRLLQGHIAWEGRIPKWGGGFNAALHYYQEALIFALRYNRFLLDEVLWGGGIITSRHSIVSYCLERGEEGRRMLIAIREWWQTGVKEISTPRPDTILPIPESITLLEAERIAREDEPGDGSPQKNVVEHIEAVLTTAHGR